MASSSARRPSLSITVMRSFTSTRSAICLLGPQCPLPFNLADGRDTHKHETLWPVLVPLSRRKVPKGQQCRQALWPVLAPLSRCPRLDLSRSIQLMLAIGLVPIVRTMFWCVTKLARSARRLGRWSLGMIRLRSVNANIVLVADFSPSPKQPDSAVR